NILLLPDWVAIISQLIEGITELERSERGIVCELEEEEDSKVDDEKESLESSGSCSELAMDTSFLQLITSSFFELCSQIEVVSVLLEFGSFLSLNGIPTDKPMITPVESPDETSTSSFSVRDVYSSKFKDATTKSDQFPFPNSTTLKLYLGSVVVSENEELGRSRENLSIFSHNVPAAFDEDLFRFWDKIVYLY
ncbi:MAG: hypothetical protein EZS28_002239, partial [Streblomastix strix]